MTSGIGAHVATVVSGVGAGTACEDCPVLCLILFVVRCSLSCDVPVGCRLLLFLSCNSCCPPVWGTAIGVVGVRAEALSVSVLRVVARDSGALSFARYFCACVRVWIADRVPTTTQTCFQFLPYSSRPCKKRSCSTADQRPVFSCPFSAILGCYSSSLRVIRSPLLPLAGRTVPKCRAVLMTTDDHVLSGFGRRNRYR